jgi:transposase
MATDTNKYSCKAAGFYSLTPEGKDYITFMENSKKETIMDLLKDIREQNPTKIIFLLIDNFSSHKADVVKNLAKELNIELCYLPPYSPQLQPIEKIWYKNKRDNMQYKIDKIKNFPKMNKEEKEDKLKEIVEKSFYNATKSKTMWNKVLNNYIKPTIKKLHPIHNSKVKLEIVN